MKLFNVLFLMFIMFLITGNLHAEEAAVAVESGFADGIYQFLIGVLESQSWGSHVLVVFMVLGTLVAMASPIAAFTKSDKDDLFLKKIEENGIGKFFFDLLKRFSIFHNKKH